jgi:hypothetical protein
MEIILYNKPFVSVCEKNLIGIFLAANIENVTPLPILMKNGNNFISLYEENLSPPNDSIFIKSVKPPKKEGKFFCKGGNSAPFIYCIFNDYDIIEGMVIFYTAANIYPSNIYIEKNGEQYHLPLTLRRYDFSLHEYFLPKIIRFQFNNELYDFTSNDEYWNKEEIFNLISSFIENNCLSIKSNNGVFSV